ncbi:putative zinc-type alcohol dehydrogenase-like protein C16A3.02c [Acaromyces ingoldii]|uniref:Putative zinc-type alcohol dehydrogenase-like protein C16A3.02c n=1 Tax=Acaromyces ingoldii TaxID=215250 RepID=A0A316YGQ5_9BASI|nr:putative zinc-type alcohol dehydrogenase-like protein C16A3.02c [Acaromyces ingoldii]PWN87283.1 putative zinc-type alcohol dehydrogenase-like protein C16A3.02c [Acaromyces ingoldii]
MSSATSAQAWQYTSPSGGVERNLKQVTVASPTPKPNQHLVEVLAASLNPADYKPVETPVVGRFLVPNPATPGADFAGRIVIPSASSDFKPGQMVFGNAGTSPFAGGALSQLALVEEDHLALLPNGISPVEGASVPVAGLTALQSLEPYVKSGNRVFINGGSGGTGVFAIQIAKALGCHVTTTCSTANVEFCKSLGADVVIDYRKADVLDALSRYRFDHVVDNIGNDLAYYFQAHRYTTPEAVYVLVAKNPSLGFVLNMIRSSLPALLGGGQRTLVNMMSTSSQRELDTMAAWMKEGKVKAIIDSTYTFDQVPTALTKLKLGRARGKIVIRVNDAATE